MNSQKQHEKTYSQCWLPTQPIRVQGPNLGRMTPQNEHLHRFFFVHVYIRNIHHLFTFWTYCMHVDVQSFWVCICFIWSLRLNPWGNYTWPFYDGSCISTGVSGEAMCLRNGERNSALDLWLQMHNISFSSCWSYLYIWAYIQNIELTWTC